MFKILLWELKIYQLIFHDILKINDYINQICFRITNKLSMGQQTYKNV